MVRTGLQRWHDVPVNLSSTAIVCTALRRPQYLEPVLASWQQARGIGDVHSFTLALGHDRETVAAQSVIYGSFLKAAGIGPGRGRVKMDSPQAAASRGMGRAIGEAAVHVLADPAVEFVVFGEEDIIVSSDVLEYFAWARETFAADERVLCVLAHSAGGAGWDEPGIGLRDGDADQEAVRLLPYYNGWIWGTWRDRWEKTLGPTWDWDVTSGGAMDSGYDHQIHRRVIPRGGYVCVVPDASRSQNIGRVGGWAAQEADFPGTQAASFRPERGAVTYRLREASERAA